MDELGKFNPSDHQPGLPADLMLEPVDLEYKKQEELPNQERAAIDLVVELISSGSLDQDTSEKIEAALESSRLDKLRKDSQKIEAYLAGVAEARLLWKDHDNLYDVASALLELGQKQDFGRYHFGWLEALTSLMQHAADMGLPDVIDQFRDQIESHGDPREKNDFDLYLDSAHKNSLIGLMWNVDGSIRDEQALTAAYDGLASASKDLFDNRERWLNYLRGKAQEARQRDAGIISARRIDAQNN
jgi:hypothetical protein